MGLRSVVTNKEATEATKYFDAVVLQGSEIVGLEPMVSVLGKDHGINVITLKTENPKISKCAIVLFNDGKGLDLNAAFDQQGIDRGVIDNYTIKRIQSLDTRNHRGDCLTKSLS